MSRENINIETIKKQFLCCTPLTNMKLEEITNELTKWEMQDYIIRETVNSKLVLKYPIKIEYQKSFVKRLIDFLVKQDAEINDVVYDTLGRLMALRDVEECFKHYYFDGNYAILKENNNIISEGTTGLCTWQASIVFSEWCIENKNLFENKRVLELGSGVGLTGLVMCKICNLKKYSFTDCHDSVLNQLGDNIELNLNLCNQTIEDKNVILRGFYKSTEIRLLNLPWESISVETKEIYEVDIAIATDVVYDKDLFRPLCQSFKFLLKYGSCSMIYLTCTERNQETLMEFFNLLDDFNVEILRTPSPKLFYWDDKVPIKIFKITNLI